MASIVGKRISGNTYYYLVESARVDGKPRIVSQRYLGRAEDIEAALEGAQVTPTRTRHLGFGDLAGAWEMLCRLGVAETVDAVVGPRRRDARLSVGTYLALAAANRLVAPCSKAAFADWWQTTAGDRFLHIPRAALDHRRFWDAMDAVAPEALREAEGRLAARAREAFGLDLSALVVDMTNFATFVDSANHRNTLCQRGKAKGGRGDLRLLGLALVVTRDGGVPILSHPYPGNRHDSTQFPSVVEALAARLREVSGDPEDLTLVFDSGQNSVANRELLDQSPFHYVGSVPPTYHPDLLGAPKSRYREVEGFEGLVAFEGRAEVLGADRRVVVTHSQSLEDAQRRGLDQTLAGARRRLREVAARLRRGRTRKPKEAVISEVEEILGARWLPELVTYRLEGEEPPDLRLRYRTDQAARRRLERELFGKRILFTSREDWSVAQVVAAYRSQADVEAGFRQLKDPRVVSFSPMHHWTDHKILVHAFYCVVALAAAHLMRREAARAGLELSVRELMGSLASIQETVLLYPSTGGRPRARRMLTDMDPTARRLYELFDLAKYAPPG